MPVFLILVLASDKNPENTMKKEDSKANNLKQTKKQTSLSSSESSQVNHSEIITSSLSGSLNYFVIKIKNMKKVK